MAAAQPTLDTLLYERSDGSVLGNLSPPIDRRVLATQRSRAQVVMKRRSIFLRRSIVSDAEKKERDAKRLASVVLVNERLAAQNLQALRGNPRPLRRFGCKLVVAVYHHTKAKGTGGSNGIEVQRRLVTIDDKMNFDQMHAWLENCLGIGLGKGKSLVIQYYNDFGCGVLVTDRRSLQSWLDQVRRPARAAQARAPPGSGGRGTVVRP